VLRLSDMQMRIHHYFTLAGLPFALFYNYGAN